MGCVQAKCNIDSERPQKGIEGLKRENGYIKEQNVVPLAADDHNKHSKESLLRGKMMSRGDTDKKGSINVQTKAITSSDLDSNIDGWPKWLVDNVPKDDLAGFIPRTADSYEKLAKVGQGTYSNVYKARDKSTGKIVALKKVRFDTSEPASVRFMAREIIMLQKLDHPNIIKLEGIATSRMHYSLYLVFDFMLSDLTKVISRPQGSRLTEPQVKSYMQQLLSGLQHCHERGILHRDIKGSNLLIDKNGVLKIADFGLANFYQDKSKRRLTSRVVTLWYRAPELLLGSTDYGVGIDLWSAGCLLAEMFVGRPIMPGRNEIEQLHKIFKLCGSPSEEYWKKVKPPATFRPPIQYQPNFRETFPLLPNSAFGLLCTLLSLDPSCRGTAASAIQTQFFTSSPLPCDPSGLPGMSVEEDNPPQSMHMRRNNNFDSKQGSRKRHGRKVSFPENTEFVAYFKEENRSSVNSQGLETGDSSSTVSSTTKPNDTEEILPRSPTPAFRSQHTRTAKTEAHPNALKNIKNYPLLLASLTEAAHHLQESNSSLYQRSLSNIDFRNLDLEKISKLFGLEDN